MTFDQICETLDDLEISGDTPFRIFYDGVEFEVLSITGHTHDGTVHIEIQEA